MATSIEYALVDCLRRNPIGTAKWSGYQASWLLASLTRTFGKSIDNFILYNRKAIQEVCRAFTRFCRDLDLLGGDLVAIDRSKFKAVNKRDRNFTNHKFKRALRDIDKKIDAYLQELVENNASEAYPCTF